MYFFDFELNKKIKEMVYKKYIKRNGRIYGPYLYNSKRVGEKVVSEYVGPNAMTGKSRKLYILFTSIAIVFVALVFLFFSLRAHNFSGNLISNAADSLKKTFTSTNNNQDNSVQTQSTTPAVSGLSSKSMISGELFQQSVRTYKDWVIVTFTYGENQIEHSYSKSLSEQELNSLIAKDKTDWLSSISK